MPVDLTVDVGVLMSGSNLGALQYSASSLELMKAIEARPEWALALDRRGRIRNQYETMVKRGFAMDWLRRLATKGKLVLVPWRGLNRGIRTSLRELHFDNEDLKYVETAAVTECNVLVSHDDDYSPEVVRVLSRVPVHLESAEGALRLVGPPLD